MRYLSRNKINQKNEPNKDAKKLYIFCEGKNREVNYFGYFTKLSSNVDIIPIPSSNGQSDPLKLEANAELLFFGNEFTSPQYSISEEYKDEVWFVIDTDRWNEGDKINQLKKFCNSKNVSYKQWGVAQSNPSFEVWLYYHFYNVKPDQQVVDNFASFKQFVNDAIKGGFDSRTMPIEIENAIKNSKINFHISDGQPSIFSTEVFNLADIIVHFVKLQLGKAREMVTNYNHTNPSSDNSTLP